MPLARRVIVSILLAVPLLVCGYVAAFFILLPVNDLCALGEYFLSVC